MSDNTHAIGKPAACELVSFLDETASSTVARSVFLKELRAIAIRSDATQELVEPDGIEPTTSCLQSRRSPN
jgi:hypothetical protein